MGNIVGNLTQGEVVQVFGRLFTRVGEKMDEGEYADGVQISEIIEQVQKMITDLLKEYADED